MNRKWYFFLHFPIIGAIPALGFIAAKFSILNHLPPETSEMIFGVGVLIWMLGMIVGIPYIIAMRMNNAFGLGFGMSFIYFLSMFFVPIPGWRLIPWIAGFFIPPDEI